MKSAAFLLASIVFTLGTTRAAAAEPGKGYDGFRLMQTRNIFDPNRRAAAPREQRQAEQRPRGPRSSSLTLTGTMVTEDRALAFFGGSRADFSKVAKIGDTVGNYKVLAITSADVELEREGKRVTLAVGRQQQVEGSPGDPVEEPAPETASAETSGANPAATSANSNPPVAGASAPASAPASSSSGGSDVLRRMMERRQKEMSK